MPDPTKTTQGRVVAGQYYRGPDGNIWRVTTVAPDGRTLCYRFASGPLGRPLSADAAAASYVRNGGPWEINVSDFLFHMEAVNGDYRPETTPSPTGKKMLAGLTEALSVARGETAPARITVETTEAPADVPGVERRYEQASLAMDKIGQAVTDLVRSQAPWRSSIHRRRDLLDARAKLERAQEAIQAALEVNDVE